MELHEHLQIKVIIEQLKNLDFSKFYHTELGTKSIEELRPQFEDFYLKLEIILKYYNKPNRVNSNQTLTVLTQIKQNIEHITSSRNDDEYLSRRKPALDSLGNLLLEFNDIYSKYGYYHFENILVEQKDSQKLISDLEDSLRLKELEFQTKVDEVNKQKERLEKEFETFNAKFKDVYSVGTVESGNTNLINEIEKLKKNRLIVIVLLSAFGIILFITLCVLFNNFCFEFDCINSNNLNGYTHIDESGELAKNVVYYEMIKAILFRVLIISLMIFIISFLIGLFKSISHNIEVRSHKLNALKSALDLAAGISKESVTHGEILKIAAENIFTHQKTGYLKKEENLNPITKIVNRGE